MVNIARRAASTLAAMAFGQVLTIAFQLLCVPLFLLAWGKTQYGEWLLLTTVPRLLVKANLGYVSANNTQMLLDRAESSVRQNFQTAWLMTVVLCLIIVPLLAIVLPFVCHTVFDFSTLSTSDVVIIACALAFQICVYQTSVLLEGAFRTLEKISRGVMWRNAIIGGGFTAIGIGLALKATPVVVAVIWAATQFLICVAMFLDLRRFTNLFRLSFGHASWEAFRSNLSATIAYFVMPLASALRQQAMLWVVGVVHTPTEVVLVSTTRTLVNFATQMIRMINRSVTPELSLVSQGDAGRAKMLIHRKSVQLAGLAALGLALGLVLFGKPVYEVWTRHQVGYSGALLLVLTLGTICNAIWFTSISVPMSINKHQVPALAFLLLVAVAAVAQYLVGVSTGSLVAIALAFIVVDILMIPLVLRDSLSITGDGLRPFLQDALHAPSLATQLFQRLVLRRK